MLEAAFGALCPLVAVGGNLPASGRIKELQRVGMGSCSQC